MSKTINGSGDVSRFPDIHGVIDGKLIKYNIITRFSKEDKQNIITALIGLVNTYSNSEIKDFGIKGLSVIRQDANELPNYHSTDNIYACDVLIEISIMIQSIKDEEIISTACNHLCEQMKDMIITNGFCPSGRSRCFQVYMFLRDYLDKTYLPK